jgi:phosphonate metabolism-associated iron-containing alcohol dehydrogenase
MPSVFHNPVAIHTGGEAVTTLARVLGGRSYILVTSEGWQRRGVAKRIAEACGTPRTIIDGIRENPTLEHLVELEPALAPLRGDGTPVVALGGGSVMDAAKAIAVALSAGGDMALVDRSARSGAALPERLTPPPILCLPTTAGTGSEVTKTATLWDGTNRAKYSLADDRLYPSVAILDPALTATAPRLLTLSAGLDALSHSMESMWNVHHNPVSDGFATAAIARIKRYLPAGIAVPDAPTRAELQIAALFAGMAISATRTALAHSISYPLTARFGLPHGLACSFTLPEVAAYNVATHPERVGLIAEAFGLKSPEDLPDALRAWLKALGVYDEVRRVVSPQSVAALGVSVITPGRADNNIRGATAADAHAILYAALDEKTWSRPEPTSTVGRVIWITGLSGAGKTTLGNAVTVALRREGRNVLLLDGDDLRAAIAGKVGHSDAERRELADRYAQLCRFLSFQGTDVVCATMSLFHSVHKWNRANIRRYIEVYLKVDLETLIARDPKGLYRRALRGEASDVAGVDLAFEAPLTPDLVLENDVDLPDLSPLAAQVLALVKS